MPCLEVNIFTMPLGYSDVTVYNPEDTFGAECLHHFCPQNGGGLLGIPFLVEVLWITEW